MKTHTIMKQHQFKYMRLILLILVWISAIHSIIVLGEKSTKNIQTENDLSLFTMLLRMKTFLNPEAIQPQKELFILGTGLPRTGTKSLKAALKYLGYKAVHMEDFFDTGLGIEASHAMHSDAALRKLVDKFLAMGYNASLDFPMDGLAFRLLKLFPNAKIIHGQRDSPEEWAESFGTLSHRMRFIQSRPLKWLVNLDWLHPGGTEYANGYTIDFIKCPANEYPLLQALPWVDFICAHFSPDLATVYRNWEERIKREFGHLHPTNQILYYNVKQGWGPLVAFLGIPMPQVPFPRINDAGSLEVVEKLTLTLAVAWPFIYGLLFLVHLWICEKLMKTIRRIIWKRRNPK